MATSIMSFGIKHGRFKDHETMVLDIRTMFQKNPYHDPRLRSLPGQHPDVAAYIESDPRFDHMYATLKRAVAMYPGPVAINCTGGKHRSVYLADRLAEELQVPVYHRDLNKED